MALYFGSNIENAYVGDAKVKKIYKGDTLVFSAVPEITLIPGEDFFTAFANIAPEATSVVFTKSVIPSNKISSATIVSTEDSDVNAYMYLDGDTIYVSPEEDNVTIYANEDCTKMFAACTNVTLFDFSNFDTSRVTNMRMMFYTCASVISLDLSNFDTSKVTDMSSMFNSCMALTSLDLSNFNTSKVTNMSNMFYYCNKLTSLDLSNFNTSKVTSMSGMFNSCMALTSLDLSNFNTSNIISMNYMFQDCTSLVTLDLSNWDTSNVSSMEGMFNNCNKLSGSITIMNPNIFNYDYMFYNCSTNTNAKFIVKYADGCKDMAQTLVNTKSSNSNVILGGRI